ncbi:putative spermidine/putrescine transport system substrate-binding protein [Bradyrhizobium sp. USDA 4524]|uniref:ABC transporter substrate-binding protein n=1 Tax=unclassified Bradyrhizobium TaxID=2631580 RepID=UPI00209F28C5|nr:MULTISPECIES: ABC transporter substrate-binding protein [unclassified Bradyrhizobium]MCP1838604.1 putative spermidine/putrescine transport system substrate-binding protein [Bradyrhizobium sp. USDA 4538]MCP1899169.1 putative spermidine/putrescine transport system substrate-binding protein [Bradyrhizobium sp. USDA 4537]MCP1986719.1 putative spermidine/putrescine transport system substrate-binding protein [Bradyrhizobium sp. USDA 4539]
MRKPLRIASGLAVIGLAVGAFASAKLAFADDRLTITSYGGAYQSALRKAMLEPFSKESGIKITEDEYNGEYAKIRAMVQSNSVSWNVVDMALDAALELCADGSLEPIDWTKLGLDRAKFIGGYASDCGVPYAISTTVFAYDKEKLPNGPKTIADFFDLQKFPGKRGMKKSYPDKDLEWALIADGVPVKEVYKVLTTSEGVDRAFRKLDTIKKDVIWYQSLAQAAQLLADGQVVMTMSPYTRIYDAVNNSGKHFETVWDANVWELALLTIPKGSPRLDAAYKFLTFAGSPQSQADLTRYTPVGPPNKDSIPLIDPAMLPYLPTAPQNMANALPKDAAFWADKGAELSQRFTAWLAK